jgi:hypothetical protein
LYVFPLVGRGDKGAGRWGEESETDDSTQWDPGVSSLSDAERDACDVVQALAGLAALLARPGQGQGDPELDDLRRTLLSLAENGGAAQMRVLAYLRSLRRAGDGEEAAVPPRLGPWREWVPPRGNLFGRPGVEHRIGEVHHRRRADPGE